MKYSKLLLIAAAALAVAACATREDIPAARNAIRFTSNLGTFTKVTDTDFEAGDAVSLFVNEPINLDNVKMTFEAGELVPEQAISWPEDMSAQQYTTFFALYPYNQEWENWSNLNVFSVNADQSTQEGYTESDLLGATYMAYPDCETVPLNFTHKLCRVIISSSAFNDYGKVDRIKEVYVSDVYGKVRVGLWYSIPVETVGEKGTVKAGRYNPYSDHGYEQPEAPDWDEKQWKVILPPQAMDFKVVAITESGAQYAFKANNWEDIWMEGGHTYSVGISIYGDTETADPSVEITDWTADNDAQFGDYVPDERHTEGTWMLFKNGEWVDMLWSLFDDDSAEIEVDATPADKFSIAYKIYDHRYEYGMEEGAVAAEGKHLLVLDGKAFSVPAEGRYLFNVYAPENVLTVSQAEEWYMVGNFGTQEEWWQMNNPMTREDVGVYSIEFDYWGENFQFCSSSGYKSFGLPYTGSVYASNYYFRLMPNGNNISLEESGRYKITIEIYNSRMKVVLLESFVESISAGLLGNWQFVRGEQSDDLFNIFIARTETNDLDITINGETIPAILNKINGSFSVGFDEIGPSWEDPTYGTLYKWLYAEYNDGAGYYWGTFDKNLAIFTGTLSEDGQSLDIQPGHPFDGGTFTLFSLLDVFWGEPWGYERYFVHHDYWGDMPLPEVWTRVNE